MSHKESNSEKSGKIWTQMWENCTVTQRSGVALLYTVKCNGCNGCDHGGNEMCFFGGFCSDGAATGHQAHSEIGFRE